MSNLLQLLLTYHSQTIYLYTEIKTLERHTYCSHCAMHTVEKAGHQTGKLLFEEGRPGVDACSSCHNLVHPTAPFLQAQHADYIRKQLNDFKQGHRVGSRAAVMTGIAGLLSGDEIDAVADYLQSSGR